MNLDWIIEALNISIHALLAESDYLMGTMATSRGTFLSTLSLRRATEMPMYGTGDYEHFYPRSPCGERHGRHCVFCRALQFLSTLSLRRATCRSRKTGRPLLFLSTLSLRRATPSLGTKRRFRYFYPRSPCGERHSCNLQYTDTDYFYPRSPCGERLDTPVCKLSKSGFLSTLSLRRATIVATYNILIRIISIHALLAESDPITKKPPLIVSAFLSTLSLRRATPSLGTKRRFRYFYPRSPCGERRGHRWIECRHPLFLSTLSLRRAT